MPPGARPPFVPAEPFADGVVGAAVDVGANSVHLLVASVRGHELRPLADESVFLGLGDRVSAVGFLGRALRASLAGALAGYAARARELGAREVTVLGTEPVRRAADAAAAVLEVERVAGVALHVIDHDEEGLLTLIGVTGGRPVTGEVVVVDIGGGSSEVVVARPSEVPVTAGLAVGSAGLTRRFAVADPVAPDEVRAMHAEARRVVAGAPPARPAELVAVGGTASNLVRVVPGAGDRVLTRERVADALALLATEPSADASTRHGVNPVRARILPAGAAIVDAILEHYGMDGLRVSEDGIREGAVLAAAVAGRAWRDRLRRLALGWDG